ncbi:MAG: 50S ribosomal protein L35ae [Candidatus Woesearchaeota archaeon]
MEGRIMCFRQGRHTQTNNQMLVSVADVDTKEKAEKLVGKSVQYTTPTGNTISGEVRAVHGNKGALRVLFERGMPGQAIGQKVVFS